MSKKIMWLVPPSDKKTLIEFFGNRPMPWAQSNPIILMIAGWVWKKEGKKDNGKDETQ